MFAACLVAWAECIDLSAARQWKRGRSRRGRGMDWPAVVTQLELLGRAVHELGRGDCKARFPVKFAGGLPFSLGDLWLC